MQWYYAIGDQRHGPVEQAEFDRLVADGTITANTLVWRQGMTAWQPRSAVVAGATGSAPPVDDGTEVCAVSGKRFPRRDMINYEGKWISAEHRDAFFQRMREGIAQPGESAVAGGFGFGGFWRRFLAKFVDGLILGVVLMPLSLMLGLGIAGSGAAQSGDFGKVVMMQLVLQVFSISLGIAFEVFFIRKFDATPGKMALGLKLLRPNGEKLSVGRIIGRYFAHWLNAFTLLIGYIMAGFDDEKRALHDRICDTRVFKTR